MKKGSKLEEFYQIKSLKIRLLRDRPVKKSGFFILSLHFAFASVLIPGHIVKKIIFVRHAKSSWNSGVSRDIDRPLNQRGRRDAPIMAQKLKELCPNVDGILLSPSKRTRETATYFKKVYSLSEEQTLRIHELYHGSLYDVLDAVHSLPEDWSVAILFGHNPGMTYVAEYFGLKDVINVPTCGILLVESKSGDWASLNDANSKIKTFEYPKKYNT